MKGYGYTIGDQSVRAGHSPKPARACVSCNRPASEIVGKLNRAGECGACVEAAAEAKAADDETIAAAERVLARRRKRRPSAELTPGPDPFRRTTQQIDNSRKRRRP